MVMCAAYRCGSYSDKKELGVSFHRFPKDIAKSKLWVENMKLQDWTPTKNSRLCSKHFEEKCFYRTDLKVRLLNEAIPTIFTELPRYLQPTSSKTRKRTFDGMSKETSLKSKTSLSPRLSPSQAGPSTSRLGGSPKSQTSPSRFPGEDTPRKKRLKRRLFLARVKNVEKSRKIKVLGQTVKRCKRRIASMRSLIHQLEAKNLINAENSALLSNLPVVQQELLKRKAGSRTKFSPQLRKFAVTLNFLSPKAYQYVRSEFNTCLPHPSTIGKWFQVPLESENKLHLKNYVARLTADIVSSCLETRILFPNLDNHALTNEVNHVYFLIKAICSKYLNVRLHFICKRKSEQKDIVRNQLTKLILFKGQ